MISKSTAWIATGSLGAAVIVGAAIAGIASAETIEDRGEAVIISPSPTDTGVAFPIPSNSTAPTGIPSTGAPANGGAPGDPMVGPVEPAQPAPYVPAGDPAPYAPSGGDDWGDDSADSAD